MPLDLRETAAYLAKRIHLAGGDSLNVFTREAVQAIHHGAGGIPRLINVISDNALVNGFAAGQRPVGRDIIRDVCLDFDLPVLAAPANRRAVGSGGSADAPTETATTAATSSDACPSGAGAAVTASPPLATLRIDHGHATAAPPGILTGVRVIPIGSAPPAAPVAEPQEHASLLRRWLRWPLSLFTSRERA